MKRPTLRRVAVAPAVSGPPLPKRGPTGAKVVSLSMSHETAAQRLYRMFTPQPPEREVDVYDDCGCFAGTRKLSAREYAAAMKEYRAALAAYRRTGGKSVTGGLLGHSESAPKTEVSVECADGSTASGIWVGDRWHWTETGRSNVSKGAATR